MKRGSVRAVGGCSVSMGMAMKDVDGLPAGDTQAIIPAKSAQEMQRLLGDGDTLATVRMARTQLQVNGSGFRLSTKAIDAGYPDYERMMQIDTVATVTADREALKRSLSRIALVSNQTSRAVSLTMGARSEEHTHEL